MKCKIAQSVSKMVLERSAKGFKKYGVTLERKDLTTRQWIQHLQEELLDAACYLERLKSNILSIEDFSTDCFPLPAHHRKIRKMAKASAKHFKKAMEFERAKNECDKRNKRKD